MQVILLERIHRLGDMGEVVTVKPGFARNYLLPQKKALRATKENIEHFAKRRTDLERTNAERRGEAETISARMKGLTVVLVRQAGETGQLYGSVTARDIADAVTAAGYPVERSQVHLDRPIKTLGLYPLRLSLHPEVVEDVTINVAQSAEAAERQARGEAVVAPPEAGAPTVLPEEKGEASAAEGEAQAAPRQSGKLKRRERAAKATAPPNEGEDEGEPPRRKGRRSKEADG